MNVNNNENNIEKLKKRLYKKEESFDIRMRRKQLEKDSDKDPISYWKSSHAIPQLKKRPRFGLLKSLIILSVIFFLVSAGVVAYLLLGGKNIVSSRNIKIDIKSPIYTDAGSIIDFRIFIENNNNSALELTDLIIEYPKGSVSAEDFKPLESKERYSLGRINAKETVNKLLNFVLLGEEEEEKKIIVTLEYRLEDSNAIFVKTEDYIIKILNPPLGVSIITPKNIRSNQEMIMNIKIVSNSEVILYDLVLEMEYPPGFQFISANPQAAEDDTRWLIGDLKAFQERNIEIHGIIEGLDLAEKAIHAKVGITKRDGSIIIYGNDSETVVLKKPFLDLRLVINGQDSEINVSSVGNSVKAYLIWNNNSPFKIRNAVVEMKIKGEVINMQSISVSQGFYRASDNTLVWNSSSLPALSSITPGQGNRAHASFVILEALSVNSTNDKNFDIILEGKIYGISVSDEGDIKISNDVAKKIKIASKMQIAGRALHYSGAFENSGPMPPKVNKETTYTITWSISNFYNNISNVNVKASLPSYIRWVDNISPEGSDISFNESTGEVIWRTSNISAGTGILQPAKEIAFQIGLTPSLSQVGSFPTLIFGAILEAHDDFADIDLTDTKSLLNTKLNSDPKFKPTEGKVVE